MNEPRYCLHCQHANARRAAEFYGRKCAAIMCDAATQIDQKHMTIKIEGSDCINGHFQRASNEIIAKRGDYFAPMLQEIKKIEIMFLKNKNRKTG